MAQVAAEIRSFLIADVRGCTAFTVERGDEAAARLAMAFAALVERAAGRQVAGEATAGASLLAEAEALIERDGMPGIRPVVILAAGAG